MFLLKRSFDDGGRTAARFEADWRSADALANLGATSAAASAAASAERGVDEGRGGALGRDGPNTDRDQR